MKASGGSMAARGRYETSIGCAEDAEQAVLSAVLLEPASLDKVSSLLQPDDFSQRRHSRIMASMHRLAGGGCKIDPITLANDLESLGELAAVGGKDYIGWLLDVVPTAANVTYHAGIVLDQVQRRELARTLDEGSRLALAGQLGPADIASAVRTALETLERSRAVGRRAAVRALDAIDPKPIRFAIEGIMTAGDIALLVGDGGAFKSSAAIHMAGAIAGGYSVFDQFETQQGAALIVSAEDDESVIQMRLEAFVAGHRWDRTRVLGNAHILADSGATLADERWRAHILQEVQRTGARFVVLDPLADLLTGDENSNSEMRPVIRFARALSAATGATPTFVHHAGKAGPEKRPLDRIRGASALASAARSILFFDDTDAGVRVEHLKMSRGPKLAPFILKRTIDASPEDRANWLAATLRLVTERAVTRNRAEEFVIAQVTASPRGLTTSGLKTAAKGTGISGEDVSGALAALQACGQIGFEPGRRNSKHWFPASCRDTPGRVMQASLPTLPDGCPASSPELAGELAPLWGAGKLASESKKSDCPVPDQNGSRPRLEL